MRQMDRKASIMDEPIEEIREVTEENIPPPRSNISTTKISSVQPNIIPVPMSPATIPGSTNPPPILQNDGTKRSELSYLKTKHFLGAGPREPLKILQKHLW